MDTAFALHAFDQDRDGLRGGRRFDRIQVIEWHLLEAVGERKPCILILLLAGSSRRRQRAPMERVVHADDLERAIAVEPTILPSQLDGALVRLGAAVREERLHAAADVIQLLGQLYLPLVNVEVRDMDQLRGLLLNGPYDRRVGVPQHIGGDTRDEIEIDLAVRVPYTHALAPLHDQLAIERVLVIFALKRLPIALLRLRCR